MRSILSLPRIARRSGIAAAAILAITASVLTGTASAASAAHSSMTPLATARGFTLTHAVHNPDGTIAAILRSKSGERIYYLGRPGARISLVPHTTVTRHGRKKITRTTYVLGASIGGSSPQISRKPHISIAAQMAALRRSTTADALRGGFPRSVATSFASEIRVKPGDNSGGGTLVGTTCINFFDLVNVVASGCDTRTALQKASGNNFIADDMQAKIIVSPYLEVALTRINVWMDYTSTTTNTVSHLDPLNPESTNCGDPQTWTVSWYGVSFSSTIQTCGGTMTTWGLGDWKGGGGWTGNLKNNDTVVLEPIIQDHNTDGTHTNPDSVFDITTQTTATTFVGQCADGKNCG